MNIMLVLVGSLSFSKMLGPFVSKKRLSNQMRPIVIEPPQLSREPGRATSMLQSVQYLVPGMYPSLSLVSSLSRVCAIGTELSGSAGV